METYKPDENLIKLVMDNGPIIFENVITALKSDDLKNRN
jgi:hypothetical protein